MANVWHDKKVGPSPGTPRPLAPLGPPRPQDSRTARTSGPPGPSYRLRPQDLGKFSLPFELQILNTQKL